MRRSLQMEHEASLGKLRQEAEEQLRRAEKEREVLQEELRSVQHERDQSLLQAETEKQQVRSEFCLKSYFPALSISGYRYRPDISTPLQTIIHSHHIRTGDGKLHV